MKSTGYPEPYGLIIGSEPPTDQAVWTFNYGCAVLHAIEEAEVWLEIDSTGGQAVANGSYWSHDNETCLSNSTYLGGKVQDSFVIVGEVVGMGLRCWVDFFQIGEIQYKLHRANDWTCFVNHKFQYLSDSLTDVI